MIKKPTKLIPKYRKLIEGLRNSENRYQALFEQSRDAIIITSPEGKFIDINQSALDLFGYDRDELMGNSVYLIYANYNDRKYFIKEILKQEYVRNFEVKLKKKSGVEMDCLFTFSIRRSANNKILEYQGIIRDITATKQMEKKLLEMSIIDDLTGLYNRRGLFIMADQHLKVAKRMKNEIYCIFVDIDSMKLINDTFGHPAGDSALKAAANFLRGTFRESDIISRYGGDEFLVLTLHDAENKENILARFNQTLKFSTLDRDRQYNFSLSAGISTYKPGTDNTLEEIISEADILMYKNKKDKKNNPLTI
ncbi:MAG: sensor domain-containing diguanylate cyclase [Spirochaetota bacterium]